jgi:hypothetical protein
MLKVSLLSGVWRLRFERRLARLTGRRPHACRCRHGNLFIFRVRHREGGVRWMMRVLSEWPAACEDPHICRACPAGIIILETPDNHPCFQALSVVVMMQALRELRL